MTKTKKMIKFGLDGEVKIEQSLKKPTKSLSKALKARVNKTPVSHMVKNALKACNNGDGVHLATIRNFIRIQYNNYKRPGKELQSLIKEYMKEQFDEGNLVMVNSESEKINFTKRFDYYDEDEDDGKDKIE